MSEAALGLDRLPWLPDEPPVRSGRTGSALPLAAAAALLLGAAGYWLGLKVLDQSPRAAAEHAATSQTVALPRARPLHEASPGEPRMEPVEPIVAAPVAVNEQSSRVRAIAEEQSRELVTRSNRARIEAPAASQSAAPHPTEAVPQIWPVRRVDGAAGRLIRVGVFGSVHQAKRGWWAIVRVNPTLEHLPALVVPVQSGRNGSVYYRLQMGTTSQAHSEVLCQRMRVIGESCVVIGLNGGKRELAL